MFDVTDHSDVEGPLVLADLGRRRPCRRREVRELALRRAGLPCTGPHQQRGLAAAATDGSVVVVLAEPVPPVVAVGALALQRVTIGVEDVLSVHGPELGPLGVLFVRGEVCGHGVGLAPTSRLKF